MATILGIQLPGGTFYYFSRPIEKLSIQMHRSNMSRPSLDAPCTKIYILIPPGLYSTLTQCCKVQMPGCTSGVTCSKIMTFSQALGSN